MGSWAIVLPYSGTRKMGSYPKPCDPRGAAAICPSQIPSNVRAVPSGVATTTSSMLGAGVGGMAWTRDGLARRVRARAGRTLRDVLATSVGAPAQLASDG